MYGYILFAIIVIIILSAIGPFLAIRIYNNSTSVVDKPIIYLYPEQETELFIELATNRFNNLGYNVYCTTETYKYKNQTNIVQPNELMVAIK